MHEMIYVVVNAKGVQRFRRTPPNLARGEIVIRVVFNVDDKVFLTPILQGEINVGSVEQLPDIDLVVRDALRGRGLDIQYKYDQVREEKP